MMKKDTFFALSNQNLAVCAAAILTLDGNTKFTLFLTCLFVKLKTPNCHVCLCGTYMLTSKIYTTECSLKSKAYLPFLSGTPLLKEFWALKK